MYEKEIVCFDVKKELLKRLVFCWFTAETKNTQTLTNPQQIFASSCCTRKVAQATFSVLFTTWSFLSRLHHLAPFALQKVFGPQPSHGISRNSRKTSPLFLLQSHQDHQPNQLIQLKSVHASLSL